MNKNYYISFYLFIMKLTNFIYWKFFKLDLFENEISSKKNFIYLFFDEEFDEESFNYSYHDFWEHVINSIVLSKKKIIYNIP